MNTNIHNYFGCIILMGTNDSIIYGLDSNRLIFSLMPNGQSLNKQPNNINYIDKMSCKIVKNESVICAYIISLHFQLYSFNYLNNNNDISLNYNPIGLGNYISLALYDTTISETTKIVCAQKLDNNKKILCLFFKINKNSTSSNINTANIENLGQENIAFTPYTYNFTEKDCCFSEFNNEYLFCCGGNNFIICYRLDTNYSIIKKFYIKINGQNSYLSIMTNNVSATFIFMNNDNKVYDYIIYLPYCNNKEYSFFNSMNENRTIETKERLINLFEVKTNNTYLKFDNAPYDFGYFILNNFNDSEVINSSNKTNIKNNDYIIDFIITNKEKITSQDIIINYTVSVADEAYANQCQILFNFLNISQCYHSCKTCSINIYGSNTSYHNCLECKDNYYPSPILKTNCYTYNEKEINWYYESSNSSFALCNMECKSCSGPSNNECMSCHNGSYLYLSHCQG